MGNYKIKLKKKETLINSRKENKKFLKRLKIID